MTDLVEYRCSSCDHWDGGSDAKTGRCRINPPTFISERTTKGYWPVTMHDDWCGKFALPLEDWTTTPQGRAT